MTRSIQSIPVTILLAAALIVPGSALAEHHEAAEGSVAVADQIQLKGKVVAINKETRTITVEGQAGRHIDIHAPADSPNFDQIEVGDPVTATYVESVAIAIAPVEGATPGITETIDVSRAPEGASPKATISESIEMRAVVKAVDTETRKVTLDVPGGGERTVKVDNRINIEKIKVGEQVTVTLTRALAISIDKQS
jgi:Cu/Ag efflux protein CusF